MNLPVNRNKPQLKRSSILAAVISIKKLVSHQQNFRPWKKWQSWLNNTNEPRKKKARPDTFHEIFLVVFWVGSFCHGLSIKIPYRTGVGFTQQTTIQRWQLTGILVTVFCGRQKNPKFYRESRGMLGTWKFQPIAITVIAINLGPVKASNPVVLKMVYWLVVEPTHLKTIRKNWRIISPGSGDYVRNVWVATI